MWIEWVLEVNMNIIAVKTFKFNTNVIYICTLGCVGF